MLQAQVSITDATGAVLFSEVKTASNLMPGSSIDLSSLWNTGLTMPGNYTATVQVSFDGGAPVTRSSTFTINTLFVLTGTIAASPSVVAVGNGTEVTYTFSNTGNADAPGLTARVTIIDPETRSVMQTQDSIVDITQNTSKRGQITVNTTGYGLRTYEAVLQTVNQGITKNLADTLFTVKDLTPPVVAIITSASNSIYSSTVAISVIATDNASGVDHVEYQLDRGPWRFLPIADSAQGRYGTTWDPQSADSGSHVIGFRATDKAGNISEPVSEVLTIQVQTDTTPPVLTLSTLPDGSLTSNDTLNIAGTATDNIGLMGVTINGATVTVNPDGTFSQAIKLEVGPNTITSVAGDLSGNITTDTRTIILDQTAPVITIANPADNGVTNALTVMVDGTTDKKSTVLISVNSGATVTAAIDAMGFSLPVSLLTNTVSTITVYATDLAGNTATSKRTVTNDETSPGLAVTVPNQDMGTNQAGIVLSGTVTDLTNVSLLVSCPSASAGVISTPTTTTWSVNITDLQPGVNSITAQATDEAGNSTSVMRNIIYTATPITIDPVKTPTNDSQQMVTGTMELASTVLVTCPTSSVGVVSNPTPTTWQVLITGMAEGSNIISATAIDLEGHASNPVIATILLDTQVPPTNPGLSIATSTLVSGTTGSAYSQSLKATGGTTPYTWSITAGSLPCGFTLKGSTGVITGTPMMTGTYTFTAQVKDASRTTRTKTFSISIYTPISIKTTSLPAGTVNMVYSQTLAAKGGKTPYSWLIASGSLPADLTLNSATGVISGTPTSAVVATFTVEVKDVNDTVSSKILSITIRASLSITTSSLTTGTVNKAYNQSIAATGGVTPYTWSISSGHLPLGLTLNSTTGVISGKPTTKGTSSFTVKVTDSKVGTATKSLSIAVN